MHFEVDEIVSYQTKDERQEAFLGQPIPKEIDALVDVIKKKISSLLKNGRVDLKVLREKSDAIVQRLTEKKLGAPSESNKLSPAEYQSIYHISEWLEDFSQFYMALEQNQKQALTEAFESTCQEFKKVAENYKNINEALSKAMTAHYASEQPDLLIEDPALKKKESYHFESHQATLYEQIKYYLDLLFIWVVKKVVPKGHIALMNSYQAKGDSYVCRFEMNPGYTGLELQLHQLFTSELYQINILKLIPGPHHKKLHKLLETNGDDEQLALKLHQQYSDQSLKTLREGNAPIMPLTGLNSMLLSSCPAAILSLFNLQRHTKKQDAKVIHDRLRIPSEEEISPGRTCASHVANVIITNLYALNKSLNKQLDTENISYVDIPLLDRPLETIFPHEIFSDLEAKGAISVISPPPEVTDALKLGFK